MNERIFISVDGDVPLQTLMRGLRSAGLLMTFNVIPIEKPAPAPENMPINIHPPRPPKAAKKTAPAKAAPVKATPPQAAKNAMGSAVSAYWARMTPEERSAEIKRRQEVRDGKKPKKGAAKTPAKKSTK